MKWLHIYGFSTLSNVFALVGRNGVDYKNIPRLFSILALLILLFPLRVIEFFRFNYRANQYEMTKDPIFIIGHWRSGTTFLQSLLCKDPQFGFIPAFASFMFPYAGLIMTEDTFIHKLIKNKKIKRPQDNMIWSLNHPDEEEFALASISIHSAFHGSIFQHKFDHYARSYVFHDNSRLTEKWQKDYSWVVRKISMLNRNRQLILKNPYNTAKIPLLLKLFPNARFIHIYRNPYVVYRSTMSSLIQPNDQALKVCSDMPELILKNYARMMKTLYRQIEEIPKDNIVEIRYEDLVKTPLSNLQSIYKIFHLEGFEKTSPILNEYIKGLRSYKTNRYTYHDAECDKVEAICKDLIDRWNYERPDSN